MSDDITSDGKATNEDKSSGSAKVCLIKIFFRIFFFVFLKLESMSKEELIKIVKNQIIAKKKLEIKINELTISNTSLCQTEEVIKLSLVIETKRHFFCSNSVIKLMMINLNIPI
jgi:hypothetical protein